MKGSVSFRVLTAEGCDRREWLAVFDSWSGWEAYAHPDYLSLYREEGAKPLCAIYRCPDGQVIYPLLIRSLGATQFWGHDDEELYDVVSAPYGYGGPFVEGTGDKRDLVTRFFEKYEAWARSRNVVSEYLQFTPEDENELRYPGEVLVRMPVVVRTLDLSPEEIFSNYKKKLRWSLRAAERAGVQVEVDLTGERVNDFLDIYQQTMNRRGADPGYHMNLTFLQRFNRTLAGYYAYFFALLNGRAVSTELVTISANSIDFFRGGTLAESFPAHPNHLLKHHIILWSREKGKRVYLLGGGNVAQDSLYQYKLSFAPRGTRPLRVGKWVLSRDRYEQLVAARRAYENARGVDWVPRPGYFPEYRAPSAQ